MPPSSAAAYQTLQNFGSSMLKPDQAIAQGNQQYGVAGVQSQLDALRTLTGNLQTGINNVDPSVTGRTQGSLVTEAQRQAIVNKERSPLVTQFNETASHLSDVGHQFDEAQGLASNYANALLSGQQQQYGNLQGQYGNALEAEKAAEAKRQFDASLAESRAARAAANTGLDLSQLINKNPNGVGSITAAATPDQFMSVINGLRAQPGGAQQWTWGSLASYFKKQLGLDPSADLTGTAADKALHAYFSAASNSGGGGGGSSW